MSSELVNARKKFNAVSTFLKKGKYMAAVQSVHDGLILFLKKNVMKGEREEVEELLRKVTLTLNSDAELRKIYPLVISYEPGEERALLDAMRELLQELQKALNEEVQGDMQAILLYYMRKCYLYLLIGRIPSGTCKTLTPPSSGISVLR